jgi:hypothetical protein
MNNNEKTQFMSERYTPYSSQKLEKPEQGHQMK